MKIFTKVSTPLKVNSYVLIDGGNAVIIDPSGRAEYLLDIIRGENAVLKGILLTHAHFDHIMAIDGLLAHCPGTPVCVHEADIRALNDPSSQVKYYFRREHVFLPDHPVSDGEILNFGTLSLRVLHTPGHSAGSVCYLCNGLLFSGDTLLDGTVGRWDFVFGSYSQLKHSIDRLLTELPNETVVYPGHYAKTTIGKSQIVRDLF